MTYITEAELREQLRIPRTGASIVVPVGARFSAAAADFIKDWKLILTHGEDSPHPVTPAPAANQWDKPASFPVNLSGELPRCTQCGTGVSDKPSSMTQLNAHHYVHKNHPRIVLRGRLDSLHALLLMAGHHALKSAHQQISVHLESLGAYCRELISAEYNEREAAELSLATISAEDLHAATHDPMTHLGLDHLTLGVEAIEVQHWLNLARTSAREVELTAAELWPSPHDLSGASICHGLNRLSSALYYLQLVLSAEATTSDTSRESSW